MTSTDVELAEIRPVIVLFERDRRLTFALPAHRCGWARVSSVAESTLLGVGRRRCARSARGSRCAGDRRTTARSRRRRRRRRPGRAAALPSPRLRWRGDCRRRGAAVAPRRDCRTGGLKFHFDAGLARARRFAVRHLACGPLHLYTSAAAHAANTPIAASAAASCRARMHARAVAECSDRRVQAPRTFICRRRLATSRSSRPPDRG